MTRTQFITILLRTVGDTSLTSEAADALDLVLYDLESRANWVFLEAGTTYQTENNTSGVLFSASKWPSAALTNYSKGMNIASSLPPYHLTPISKQAFNIMHDGTTGAPTHFAVFNETLHLFPTPVTGATTLPILAIFYHKTITVPTQDSDVLETTIGIGSKYLPHLMTGVIHRLLQEENDDRGFEDKWKEALLTMLADNSAYYKGLNPDS